ncbi:MAG TPA: ABC-F family ATP-binding cassette domain-containing protein [Chthoniobacterales bacterium]|jgi:ATP-binding cassette subfamily F protein 3|nr:ABC-F family ATP-binding cassette domain-containing protein [Chthoniobacterales bacterium]
MLTVSQLSKSFSGRLLFDEVSLQVNRGNRIGLVGPNGAGKSTLFSLILGETSPDSGQIAFEKSATIGFLPQETAAAGDETVLELALATTPELVHAQKIIKQHESGNGSDDAAYHRALHVFDEHGGWQLEPKAKRVLAGLAFRETDFDRPACALSGGWIMRAHLARLLVMEPDLLLLDEPTNHLDLESLQWFQEYLENYPGAIVMISHDREFLNQLVGSVVEIAHSKLVRYRGNWDNYVEQKAAREEQQLAAYKNQQKEIASLQLFADRFRAKASKASQAQSKLKQIDRMEKIAAPVARGKTIKFHFPQPPRSGLRVITLKDVDHAYADLVVYRGLNFQAERGQRTVLVGPNGAGKSTLLKLLAGVLPVQHGAREPGHNVRVGYFSQNRIDVLNPKLTVLQSVLDSPKPVPEQTARTVLGSFLFRGDDVFKPVAVLSGGEKSRLALVKLLLDPPNLLLMDEPTTHLDVGSIDALIAALKQYHGTLIFISHDVHFIRAIATSVLHISASPARTGGRLTAYPGDYQYYIDKSKAISAKLALTAGRDAPEVNGQKSQIRKQTAPGSRKQKGQKRAEAEARNAISKTKREKDKRLHEIEMQIAALEAQQKELVAALEDPAVYEVGGRAVSINRELSTVTNHLAQLTAHWEDVTATT